MDSTNSLLKKSLLEADHADTTQSASCSSVSSTSGWRSERRNTIANTTKTYATNRPKILLETLTSRSTIVVIMLTYMVFIICFCMDLSVTLKSFGSHSNTVDLYSPSCSSLTGSDKSDVSYGCLDNKQWTGQVVKLTNVISFDLEVQFNLTAFLLSEVDVVVNINIWTCYESNGCSQYLSNGQGTGIFNSESSYNGVANQWQKVLSIHNQSATLTNIALADTQTLTFLGYTFQNQESTPTNGLVKSYYIVVEYVGSEKFLAASASTIPLVDANYKVHVVKRPQQELSNIFTIILLFFTCVTFFLYFVVLTRQKGQTLPEQYWVLWYFGLVILFQNPFYCVIEWLNPTNKVDICFVSYLCNYIAQSGLFVLWLLFADSVNRKTQSPLVFFFPKFYFGSLFLIDGFLILAYQFVDVVPSGFMTQSPVEAIQNWSYTTKTTVIVWSFIYLILLFVWVIIWFFGMYQARMKLKNLPYLTTRYIQLSYRFFSVQAVLVTLFYFFQYLIAIYFISLHAGSLTTTSLADNINTLFRAQTQTFGKICFLTIYAFILAFLFLPADLMDSNGELGTALQSTYVISEDEHRDIVKARKRAIRSVNKRLLTQVTMFNKLVNPDTDVFCVHIALSLRNISFQMYYDPIDVHTVSGFDGNMDLSLVGFRVVDKFYSKTNEVFCVICQEVCTQRLVVAFRGTASKKQMEGNLNYQHVEIDFFKLTTTTLDLLDGLNKTKVEQDFDDVEEVNADSEDEKDDEEYSSSQDPAHNSRTLFESVNHNLNKVEETTSAAVGGAIDFLSGGLEKMFDSTKGGLSKVVPGLRSAMAVKVHSGFFEQYMDVRSFVHAVLRQELVKNPTTVFFTGHSLGGALATLAAIDVSIHTIPRVNAFLKRKECRVRNSSSSSSNSKANTPAKFLKRTKLYMYNFGSPRVGNRNFARLYDKVVPNSYRVVVDGDAVPGLPIRSLGYSHIGTQVLIDSVGAGSVIIDPSFVERWLRTKTKASVSAHSLLAYRKGLLGLKLAATSSELFTQTSNGEDLLQRVLENCAYIANQVNEVPDENDPIYIKRDVSARPGSIEHEGEREKEKAKDTEKGNMESLCQALTRNEPKKKGALDILKLRVNTMVFDKPQSKIVE